MNCSRKDCPEPAQWMPSIAVWAAGVNKRATGAAILSFDLPVCTAHRDTSIPDDFLTTEGKQKIQKALKQAGNRPCDFRTARMRWAPIV